MKEVKQLFERIEYEIIQGELDGTVTDIIYDSRKVQKDCLFVCIKGSAADGHQFAAEAAEQGASVLVVSEDVSVSADTAVIKVKDTRYALALLSAAYFDYPAETLKVIGITGTKGKTGKWRI